MIILIYDDIELKCLVSFYLKVLYLIKSSYFTGAAWQVWQIPLEHWTLCAFRRPYLCEQLAADLRRILQRFVTLEPNIRYIDNKDLELSKDGIFGAAYGGQEYFDDAKNPNIEVNTIPVYKLCCKYI